MLTLCWIYVVSGMDNGVIVGSGAFGEDGAAGAPFEYLQQFSFIVHVCSIDQSLASDSTSSMPSIRQTVVSMVSECGISCRSACLWRCACRLHLQFSQSAPKVKQLYQRTSKMT